MHAGAPAEGRGACSEPGRRPLLRSPPECQLRQSAWSRTRTAAWRQNSGHANQATAGLQVTFVSQVAEERLAAKKGIS